MKKEVYKNDEFVIEYWVSNSMLPFISSDLLKENIVLTQNANIEIVFKNKGPIEIISRDLNNQESKDNYI